MYDLTVIFAETRIDYDLTVILRGLNFNYDLTVPYGPKTFISLSSSWSDELRPPPTKGPKA